MHFTKKLTPQQKKRLEVCQAKLDEFLSRKPSGKLRIRKRKIWEYNSFWRCGWPITDSDWEGFYLQGCNEEWILYDTGTDKMVAGFMPHEERWARRVMELYNATGILYGYDPEDFPRTRNDEYQPKPIGMRKHPHSHQGKKVRHPRKS